MSSKPLVCSIRWTNRTGLVDSHGFVNATSGTHCFTVSVSLSFPCSCNCSAANAANPLEVEPMRKRVSSVADLLAATSARPMPAVQSTLSVETSATAAPGVFVSLRIFSMASRNSGMDFGARFVLSAKVGAANARNAHTAPASLTAGMVMNEAKESGFTGASLRFTFATVFLWNGRCQFECLGRGQEDNRVQTKGLHERCASLCTAIPRL